MRKIFKGDFDVMRKYAFQLNNAEKHSRLWFLVLLYFSQITHILSPFISIRPQTAGRKIFPQKTNLKFAKNIAVTYLYKYTYIV